MLSYSFFSLRWFVSATRSILEGNKEEKRKKKWSVSGAVGCFSFALWSKRTESRCTAPGERRRAVPSARASPRGAMRWLELGWGWMGWVPWAGLGLIGDVRESKDPSMHGEGRRGWGTGGRLCHRFSSKAGGTNALSNVNAVDCVFM